MLWWVQGLGIAALGMAAPLYWGLTQTTKARMQGRRGPSVWQTYWVIQKNWRKDTTQPEYSSWVFALAPSVVMAALVTVLIMIPWGGQVPRSWPHNLLVIFFLFGLERFWIGLTGMDSAGTFGGLGASRVTTVGTGVEPALFAAFGVLWQLSGRTVVTPLVNIPASHPFGALAWTLAAVSFSFVLLGELGRLPVDNPDTHLELTMMHEATTLEQSGRLLALSQWGAALKLTLIVGLGWVVFGPNLTSPWANVALRLGEIGVTSIALGVLESRFTKLRYFQLPGYLAAAAGIGLIAFYLTAGGLTL
jgi:formate hydrogenlyase subunit 4